MFWTLFFVVKSKKGGKVLNSIFKHTENNGEVIITGLQEGLATTSIVIPETIDGMPVIEIGPKAFQSTSITNIKIGENIRGIGEKAFYMCKKLKSVTWNHKCDVVPAFCFSECSNLTKFDFSNVKKIGLYAFYKSGLQEVYLTEKIEILEKGTFSGCSKLQSVTWHCQCDVIPAFCFSECSNLTKFDFSNVKKIGLYAFYKSGLQEVCLPKNIKVLEEGTFSGCSELQSVTWHCQCDVIPAFCFDKCSNLTQFDFSGIKKIGQYVFYKSGLQEVYLTEKIEILDKGTFSGCSKLQSVTWHCQCDVIPADCFFWCSNLMQFDFSGVKKIEARAFMGSGLTSVTLNKKNEVDQNCFAYCNDLKKIEWLSARNIKGDIFKECKNIKEIFISDKVKNIEVSAFTSSHNAEITFV